MHRSVDLAGVASRLTNAFHSSHVQREVVAYWHLVALADPGGDGRAWGLPMIELEVSTHDETTRTARAVANITSSEARTMAAQLVRLADQLDLEHLA